MIDIDPNFDFYRQFRQEVKERFESLACAYCGGKMTGTNVSTKGFICEKCLQERENRRARIRAERRNGKARLRRIVGRNLWRARRAGQPATLTVDQWIEILDRYNWRCAYCGKRLYEVLEHKTPISKGGGTTAENCVPACASCNIGKGNRIRK